MRGYKTIHDLTKEECERLLPSVTDAKMQEDLEHRLDVLDEIARQVDTDAFSACETVSDYQGYLRRFPEGLYVTDAICRFSKLKSEEEKRFKACSSWKDYQKYLADYPQGLFKDKAEKAMDERFFVEYCKSKTACKDYLRKYPQGKHVQEVKKRIWKALLRRLASIVAIIFLLFVLLVTMDLLF